MWLVLCDFVEVFLPDIVLTAMVHVIRRAASEVLYPAVQILHKFTVPICKGHIVSALVVVLDTPTRIGEHVGHECHSPAVLYRVN